MKPLTIEERAKKLGLSVRTASRYEWFIYHNGTCLDSSPSRRGVAQWLNGAEAMHKIMSEHIDTLR